MAKMRNSQKSGISFTNKAVKFWTVLLAQRRAEHRTLPRQKRPIWAQTRGTTVSEQTRGAARPKKRKEFKVSRMVTPPKTENYVPRIKLTIIRNLGL